jgi:sulfhydrogenase subunit beta (sulfur reductase)
MTLVPNSAPSDGSSHAPAILDREGLQALLGVLRKRGYRVIGPTVREGAIVYDEVASIGDLPEGWTDEQEGGKYRLQRRDDAALFGYAVGPHSWKKFLLPPRQLLWRATKSEDGFEVETNDAEPPRLAFLGVRACELRAIEVQDRVFAGGKHADPSYIARRESAFIVAVNCGKAAGTCFCVSMSTGPKVASGFDLALTELIDSTGQHFVVEVGSDRGVEVLAAVPQIAASPGHCEAAEAVVQQAASQMGRQLDTDGIKELLYRSYDSSRWDDVAERCLTCGNCTMVCPTCFCTTVEDVTDLTGEHAERWRRWDSCFTMDFTYIHGGSVRSSTKSRYRQWLTHKLGTWIDQFGTSGCVGCGRCITWCPVAIDLTEEVAALRIVDKSRRALVPEGTEI